MAVHRQEENFERRSTQMMERVIRLALVLQLFLSLVCYFSDRAISGNCNATLLYRAQFTNCLQNHLHLLEFMFAI